MAKFRGRNVAVYLPIVANEGVVTLQIQLNAYEAELERLLLDSGLGQQRPRLVRNNTLTWGARQKAFDMAARNYVAHTDPDGHGPNYLARQAGYVLPAHYNQTLTGNNIEALGAGYGTALAMWTAWLASLAHCGFLRGEHEFYRTQWEYGIGYHYERGSPRRHFWVVWMACPADEVGAAGVEYVPSLDAALIGGET